MIKKISLLVAVIAIRLVSAQTGSVGIGTDVPNSSAILDITSTNKGLLLPRIALSSTGTPSLAGGVHIAGMTVYNTATAGDVTPGLYYNDGSKWIKAPGSTAANTAWLLTGNAGTNPPFNFLGTTDNQDLVFKIHNYFAGTITGGYNVSFGNFTGQNFRTVTGNQNSAFGGYAMYSFTSGHFNTGVGSNALLSLTTGDYNTALGVSALSGLTTGTANVGLGDRTGYNLTSGDKNIFIGTNTAATNATDSNTLNIANAFFGTGLTGTFPAFPSANAKFGINIATPNSTLQVAGSLSTNINTAAGNTITANDYTVFLSSATTLPDPTTAKGRIYNIVKSTTSDVVISGTFKTRLGSSYASYTLGSTLNNMVIQSDGTAWYVLRADNSAN